MKALSVRQPWASLIAEGTKTVEVRSWRTDYHGPLVICASARFDCGFAGLQAEARTFPLGVAVCLVQLIDVVPMVAALHATAANPLDPPQEVLAEPVDGLFAWLLGSPQVISPQFPVRGKLHLFDINIPPDTRLEHPEKYYAYLQSA